MSLPLQALPWRPQGSSDLLSTSCLFSLLGACSKHCISFTTTQVSVDWLCYVLKQWIRAQLGNSGRRYIHLQPPPLHPLGVWFPKAPWPSVHSVHSSPATFHPVSLPSYHETIVTSLLSMGFPRPSKMWFYALLIQSHFLLLSSPVRSFPHKLSTDHTPAAWDIFFLFQYHFLHSILDSTSTMQILMEKDLDELFTLQPVFFKKHFTTPSQS